MKRAFLFLLTIGILACFKQGYDLLAHDSEVKSHFYGSLSDIAKEVIAIPLETAGGKTLDKTREVREDGKNLFLISGDILYRYDRNGRFICQITDSAMIRVAGYVVNPANRQLIVLGNIDDIYYYSYDGELLDKKKLKSDLPNHRMLSVSMYKDHIWSVEEKVNSKDTTSQALKIERSVVKYDSSFQIIETHKLVQVNLERESSCVSNCYCPQISISDTGIIYAYAPTTEPENLLRDTLYLKNKQNQTNILASDPNTIILFPIRFSNRFWISSYFDKTNKASSYTFCYDSIDNQSWQVKGGLTDNFYQTGPVANLEAMDLFNQSYCFCKSGDELQQSFPQRAKEGSPVLFIVKLRT